MARALILMVLMVTLVGPAAVASDLLCPEKVPLPEGADDLRMQEGEFTLDHALESLQFLRTDFAKRIWGPDAVKDFRARSRHYISYANSLKFIEGALLKQEAFLQRARRKEIAALSLNSPELPEAEKRLQAATQRFCEFMRSAEYVD